MDRTPSRPFWPRRMPMLLALAAVLLIAAVFAAASARDDRADAAPSTPLALAPAAHGAVADALQGATPVPSMSTETSRTLRRPDGTYVTRVFASAPSFRDAGGTERLIDQTLRPVLGGYRPAAPPVPTTFPATLAQPIAVDRDGTPFSMQLVGAGGRATTSGSTITYRNALRDTDVSYTVSTEALGEALRLTGPDAPSRFAFDVRSAAGVTAAKQPNGTVAFHRADGSDLIALAPSFATSDAVQGHHEQAVDTDVAVSGSGFRVTLSVDPAWLRAQLAHGPVTIDPTMALQGTARDCPLSSDLPATSFCGSSGLWVGYNGDHDHHSLAKWDLSAIPADAEALWGDFGLYQVNAGPANAKQLTMSPLTRDWTSGASWSTYDGTHAWTTPGGDADAPVATVSLPGHQSGWADWYATPLVQDWLTGARANYGVVFADAPGTRIVGEEDFLSSEGSESPVTKPELDIVWTPRTGVVDDGTFDGQPLDDNTGIAVNIANGNLFLQTRGMQVPGTGLDLAEQTYHNSLGSPTDLQGVGIKGTSSLGRDIRLKAFDPTTVAFYRGDGAIAPFTSPTTSGTTQTFVTPDDLPYDTALTRDTGTGLYTLHSPSGLPAWPGADVTLTFAASGALRSIADADGHTIALSYYSDGGSEIPQIHGIRDTNNTNYTVTRTETGDSYLGDIADPSGHHWQYTYGHDDGDYLMSFRAGDTGRTWNYDYDTSNRLTKVVTPDGKVTLIRYDGTSSRAAAIVRTTDAAHTTGPTTTYTYGAPTAPCDATAGDINKTIVTPPTGPAVTYCTDAYDHDTYDTRVTGDDQPCDPTMTIDDGEGPIDCSVVEPDLSDWPDPGASTAPTAAPFAAAVATPRIPSKFVWGFSDERNEFLQPVPSPIPTPPDATVGQLIPPQSDMPFVRLIVPYDVVSDAPATEPPDNPGPDHKAHKRWQSLQDVKAWIAAAYARNERVLISFEHCYAPTPGASATDLAEDDRLDGKWCADPRHRPSVRAYHDAVRAFLTYNPTGGPDFRRIEFFTAWNEPNHAGTQPTAGKNTSGRSDANNSGAFAAGQFWLTLDRMCRASYGCLVGAGDFADYDMPHPLSTSSPTYLQQYRAGMDHRPPAFWAWHAYKETLDTLRPRTHYAALRDFLRATEVPSAGHQPVVMITEVGVTFSARGTPSTQIRSEDDGTRIMNHLVGDLPYVHPTRDSLSARRIKAVFYYASRGDGNLDTGLVRPADNRVRRMWLPWCNAVRAPSATCPASLVDANVGPPH